MFRYSSSLKTGWLIAAVAKTTRNFEPGRSLSSRILLAYELAPRASPAPKLAGTIASAGRALITPMVSGVRRLAALLDNIPALESSLLSMSADTALRNQDTKNQGRLTRPSK